MKSGVMKKISETVLTLLILVLVLVTVNLVHAQGWMNRPSPAGSDNVSPPVYVSSGSQAKSGSLTVGSTNPPAYTLDVTTSGGSDAVGVTDLLSVFGDLYVTDKLYVGHSVLPANLGHALDSNGAMRVSSLSHSHTDPVPVCTDGNGKLQLCAEDVPVTPPQNCILSGPAGSSLHLSISCDPSENADGSFVDAYEVWSFHPNLNFNPNTGAYEPFGPQQPGWQLVGTQTLTGSTINNGPIFYTANFSFDLECNGIPGPCPGSLLEVNDYTLEQRIFGSHSSLRDARAYRFRGVSSGGGGPWSPVFVGWDLSNDGNNIVQNITAQSTPVLPPSWRLSWDIPWSDNAAEPFLGVVIGECFGPNLSNFPCPGGFGPGSNLPYEIWQGFPGDFNASNPSRLVEKAGGIGDYTYVIQSVAPTPLHSGGANMTRADAVDFNGDNSTVTP